MNELNLSPSQMGITPERFVKPQETLSPEAMRISSIITSKAAEFLANVKKVKERPNQNWQEIFQAMGDVQKMQEQQLGVGPLEKKMLNVFWGMGKFLNQIDERNELTDQLDDISIALEPDYAQEQSIIGRFDELNMTTAEWQNDIAEVTMSLGKNQEGRQFLETFWNTFRDLSGMAFEKDQDQFNQVRSGIRGVVSVITMFQRLGAEVRLPDPESDAKDKTDLEVVINGKKFIVQIKTHRSTDLSVHCEPIVKEVSLAGLSGKERTEAIHHNILFRKGKKLVEHDQREVIPLWVDLNYPGGLQMISDELTGEPSLPDNFNDTDFGKLIRILAGEQGLVS